MLLEAGGDHGDAIQVQAPNLFRFAAEDELMRWDYYVHHYQNDTRQERDPKMVWETRNGTKYVGQDPPPGSKALGILYPRSGSLGGCANHNAMITVYPFESDWDYIANVTGDASWSADSMRQYFELLERNNYLPQSASGHGFKGWLSTRLPDYNLLFSDSNIFNMAAAAVKTVQQASEKALTTITGLVNALNIDFNADSPGRDSAQNALYRLPEAVSGKVRSSPQEFILATANALNADSTRKYVLDIQLNTLVTKVRFATTSQNQKRAVGVEYLEGPSLYGADPRAEPSHTGGEAGFVNAAREVILAAGTFNTPQLLKLSGIGAAEELAKFDIPVVVDLPGVGTNIQDRYEIALVGETTHKSTVFGNCTFLTGSDDPCVDEWLDDIGQGSPYSNVGPTVVIPRRSSEADNSDNDLFTTNLSGYFDGYFPGYSRFIPNRNMTYQTWVMLKAHSRNNAGTVTLRSANPRDVPVINFNSFDTGVTTDNADGKDLDALVELLEFGREILSNQATFNEVVPGSSISTREQMEQYVKDIAWGHHASCSCPIGSDDDLMAVLDSRFRVRGVEGLRVVDASVFPKIPGFFVVLPIYMISEKAATVILEDAYSVS